MTPHPAAVRLNTVVAAVCPHSGCTIGPGLSVTLSPLDTATTEQRAAAEAVVAAFDWGPEAQAAWDRSQVVQAAAARIMAGGVSLDSTDVAVAMLIGVVCDRVNAAFDAMGRDKPLLEADIYADLTARLAAGRPGGK